MDSKQMKRLAELRQMKTSGKVTPEYLVKEFVDALAMLEKGIANVSSDLKGRHSKDAESNAITEGQLLAYAHVSKMLSQMFDRLVRQSKEVQ